MTNTEQFTQYCIDYYKNSNLSPQDASRKLIVSLRENPNIHENLRMTRVAAERVIQGLFIKKYSKQGKHIDTVTSMVTKVDKPTKAKPDMEYAATLTKDVLDDYATAFGISLNRSMTKENMLSSFMEQQED